jgi:stage II sporulation protein D
VPVPTPAWSTAVSPVAGPVTLYGRGYGHGVGLSQWGARGRALAGQTAAQILGAYFTGTTIGTVNPARTVRVLVLAGFAGAVTNPLTIHGRGGAWTIVGVPTAFPADAALTVWRTAAVVNGAKSTSWNLHVVAGDGVSVLYDGVAAASSVVISPVDPTALLQLDSKPSVLDVYRGSLRLLFGARSVSVVNLVGLDDYLKGVVPSEMSVAWPVEALNAQAIVARSWTLKHLRSTSVYTFDVYDDSRSQVYQGVLGENSTITALIAAQPGAVVLYGTGVANTFYSSAAGGWTENNEDAFVPASGVIGAKPLPYLRGVDDRAPGGLGYDAASPGYAWQTATITPDQLSAILAADPRTTVGTVTALDLTHRGASGRLYQVVIVGTAGQRTVSGDVFRVVYNVHRPKGTQAILSNLFSLTPIP